MTADRFRECLAALHWTQRGLAEIIGVNEREVRRWAGSQNQIPPNIAAWLDRLARCHEVNPPPARQN
jgi:hypothetical protein